MQVKEYLAGGLTENQLKIRIKSPNGTLAYYKQRFKMTHLFKYKVKALINYFRFYLHASHNHAVLVEPFFKTSILAAPLGWVIWLRDEKIK